MHLSLGRPFWERSWGSDLKREEHQDLESSIDKVKGEIAYYMVGFRQQNDEGSLILSSTPDYCYFIFMLCIVSKYKFLNLTLWGLIKTPMINYTFFFIIFCMWIYTRIVKFMLLIDCLWRSVSNCEFSQLVTFWNFWRWNVDWLVLNIEIKNLVTGI